MSNLKKHVMIDIETMSTKQGTAIVSIGAVVFEPSKGVLIGNDFYMELDWENQGRLIDESTLDWWSSQHREVQDAMYGIDSLECGLSELNKWFPSHSTLWSKGPHFDIAILENAYDGFDDLKAPWDFWGIRDYRTIEDLYGYGGFKPVNDANPNKHNALEDAKVQARDICIMWSRMTKLIARG